MSSLKLNVSEENFIIKICHCAEFTIVKHKVSNDRSLGKVFLTLSIFFFVYYRYLSILSFGVKLLWRISKAMAKAKASASTTVLKLGPRDSACLLLLHVPDSFCSHNIHFNCNSNPFSLVFG